jgi:dTDP-4-amino-4,6-dideoxygalactose transaminase
MARIYLSPPHVEADDKALLLEAFDSGWIAPLGPHVDAFERDFAAAVGLPHAAALSSGTAALHLALRILGVGPGDEVLVSTLTFAATANAVAYTGARPVFIDSERRSWNMDPGLLEEELAACDRRGKLPRAVVIVDVFGQCADYDPILAACSRWDVPVVEDAAEALGAEYKGRPAGSFGALNAFSFNGNKIITTSGGGMLASRDGAWIERARYFATQARDPAPHYEHSEVGYNYRLSNLLAALGRSQLRKLSDRVERRRRVNALYREALGGLEGLEFLPEAPFGRSTCWLTCVTLRAEEFGAGPAEVRAALEAKDIESRPLWKPMHLQPAFAGCRARGGDVAEDLFARGLCLPSGSRLGEEDVHRIAGLVRGVGGRRRR